MHELSKLLADYIKLEFQSAVADQMQDSYRFYFTGVPEKYLDQIFELLSDTKTGLSIHEEPENTDVFIFQVDNSASIPASPGRACKGSEKGFINLRNNPTIKYCVILNSINSQIQSLGSAVRPLGITESIKNHTEWTETDLIQVVWEKIKDQCSQIIDIERLKIAFNYSLEKIWESDDHAKNKTRENSWELVDRLLDASNQDKVSLDSLSHALGLFKSPAEDFGRKIHLSTVSKVIDFFSENGLKKGFAILREKDKKTSDLRNFETELKNSNIYDTNELTDNPTGILASLNEEKQLPEWWHNLDIHIWAELLDSDSAEGEGKLEFNINEALKLDSPGIPNVVRSTVKISIKPPTSDAVINVKIERSNGSSKFVNLGSFEVGKQLDNYFEDEEIPTHKKPLKYRLSADGYKDTVLKVIVLDEFAPGLIVDSRHLKSNKIFLQKQKSKKEDPGLVSDLHFSSMGYHQLHIYYSTKYSAPKYLNCYEVNADQPRIKSTVDEKTSGHAAVDIETDDNCHFTFDLPGTSHGMPYIIDVTADDISPEAVNSEFERLVRLNVQTANRVNVTAKPEVRPSRRTDLERYMLSNLDSYRPLILGPDFIEFDGDPWKKNEVLSKFLLPHKLFSDSWLEEVPEAFKSARKTIIELIKKRNPDLGYAFSAYLLHDDTDEKLSAAALNYMSAYEDWLQTDYESAIWSDVIVILDKQASSDVLESKPTVALLSPLHPIKLSWQINAQSVLNEARSNNNTCPVASELTPHHFPDSMTLTSLNPQDKFDSNIFVSMQSESPYWSVLWSLTDLSKVYEENNSTVRVLRSLDLMIDGLSKGFKEVQVKRAINEIIRLRPAANAISLNVNGKNTAATSFNKGVLEWVDESLGEDSDTDKWFAVGGRSLNVYDKRSGECFPEQSALATASKKSEGQLNWYSANKDTNAHLGIITHLGSTTQTGMETKLRSGTDASGLIKRRVRQIQQSNSEFLIESFISRPIGHTDKSSLAAHLLATVHTVESKCAGNKEGLSFCPDIPMLKEMIKNSAYTAISSSNIDAACFFTMEPSAYLWDYELPSFGDIASGAEGYFLLASKSQALSNSVKSGLKRLDDKEDYSNEMVSSLLDEIPMRGMPTLKQLTAGGSAALGELGTLATLKLLQFTDDTNGIIPISDNGNAINLIIPIDSFQEQLRVLRTRLFETKAGERPDLLVAHISLNSTGEPTSIHLTPIEIKTRSAKLPSRDRGKHLTQAAYFASFFKRLKDKGNDSELWGVAWRDLVCRMIDYGFRIYSQGGSSSKLDWSQIHQDTIHGISFNDLEITLDETGRLVVVDASDNSTLCDSDSDGFEETFVLSKNDAIGLLKGEAPEWLNKISGELDLWGVRGQILTDNSTKENSRSSNSRPDDENSSYTTTTNKAIIDKTYVDESADQKESREEGISFVVGESIGKFIEEDFKFEPGNTNLTQMNVGVVGDLGTGKTQLIKSLVAQLYRSGSINRGQQPNVLIFDYKRDYSDEAFVKAVNATVVEPFDIPLNLFDTSNASNTRNAWLDRVKFFNDVLRKIFSNVGPVQQTQIKAAAKAAYESAKSFGRKDPTLKDVFEAYKDQTGGKFDAPYSIMDNLVDGMHFTEDQDQVIPFSNFLTGVVVVDLSKAGADDETKNMLVAIFLNLFYEHMLTIDKKPFLGANGDRRFVDTMLLVDEADNIMKYEFPVLKQILLQGREFGVGTLLASQYLSHFKTSHENYAEPLNSWFIHKVPKIRPQELDSIGLSGANNELTDKIKQLELHQCLYKTWGVDGKLMRGKPFYELVNDQTVD